MKHVIFLLFCGIAVQAAVDRRCVEGTTWTVDCNKCSCTNGLTACTHVVCMPASPHIHKRSIAGDRCEEGTNWMMDCNSCSCMNGMPVCTEMDCLPQRHEHNWKKANEKRHTNEVKFLVKPGSFAPTYRVKRADDLVVKPNSYKDTCRSGDTWMDQDCNRCTCDNIDSTAIAICTRRSCASGIQLLPTPGWENMFNIVHHHENRKRSVDYGVVKDDSYMFNCKPGDHWTNQNCNFCSCDKNGVLCTANLCPDGRRLTPTPGWEHTYNIEQDRIGERKKRSEELIVKHNSYKKNCKTGDRWKDQDCNRCSCGDDLIAVCTKRKCSDGQKLTPTPGWENMFNIKNDQNDRRKRSEDYIVVKADSYDADCKLGDRWTDQDCNDCYCDERGVCTRRLCPDGKRLVPTPGWENIFNIDEKIIMNKQQRKKRSEELIVKPNSYTQNCRLGDVWRDQYCNKCTCDGEKAICTRKLCSDGKLLTPTSGWEDIFNIDQEIVQQAQHHRRKREEELIIEPKPYKYGYVEPFLSANDEEPFLSTKDEELSLSALLEKIFLQEEEPVFLTEDEELCHPGESEEAFLLIEDEEPSLPEGHEEPLTLARDEPFHLYSIEVMKK